MATDPSERKRSELTRREIPVQSRKAFVVRPQQSSSGSLLSIQMLGQNCLLLIQTFSEGDDLSIVRAELQQLVRVRSCSSKITLIPLKRDQAHQNVPICRPGIVRFFQYRDRFFDLAIRVQGYTIDVGVARRCGLQHGSLREQI